MAVKYPKYVTRHHQKTPDDVIRSPKWGRGAALSLRLPAQFVSDTNAEVRRRLPGESPRYLRRSDGFRSLQGAPEDSSMRKSLISYTEGGILPMAPQEL